MSIVDDDGPESESHDITVDITIDRTPAHVRGAHRQPTGRMLVVSIASLLILLGAAAVWISGHDSGVSEEAPTTTPSPAPAPSVAARDTAATAFEPNSTATPTSAPAAAVGDTPIAFVPWPAPPKDHDPTVSGRPASLPANLAPGQALLYVNDLGRPTLLDLASGDRSEVSIADTRLEDVFLVDQGHVVTLRPGRSTLREASERAMAVSIHRAGRDPAAVVEFASTPVPQLCLGSTGCPELRWATGSFGTENDRIESIDPTTDPVNALGQLLGSSSWASGPRWTLYRFADRDKDVLIPTPLEGAVVWTVTQTGPTQ